MDKALTENIVGNIKHSDLVEIIKGVNDYLFIFKTENELYYMLKRNFDEYNIKYSNYETKIYSPECKKELKRYTIYINFSPKITEYFKVKTK